MIGAKTIPAKPNNISNENNTISSSQIPESISAPNELDIMKYSNLCIIINNINAANAVGKETVIQTKNVTLLEIKLPTIGNNPQKNVINTNIFE